MSDIRHVTDKTSLDMKLTQSSNSQPTNMPPTLWPLWSLTQPAGRTTFPWIEGCTRVAHDPTALGIVFSINTSRMCFLKFAR